MEVTQKKRRRLTFNIVRHRIQEKGQTGKQIAKEYGTTEDYIYHLCRKYGTSVTELREESERESDLLEGEDSYSDYKDVLPCSLQKGVFTKCRTQCYLAPKCPLAKASGKIHKGVLHPRDYTIRGEGSIQTNIALGNERAFLVK